MALIVMKFGGTSVSTAENRKKAIGHVKAELDAGNRVAVVVSAMGRKGAPYATDTLLSLLRSGGDQKTKDLLMSCGETISACVFADELAESGVPARAFNGESAGIRVSENYGCADIIGMDTPFVASALYEGVVPVITGFQGKTARHTTATLGRGGSDTSAVVIGGYLKADAVDIYTDVPGVAKADPRIVPDAAFMETVGNADMLTLATWGASVIHPRAVEAGAAFGVPMLRVRSTFDNGTGTAILPVSTGAGFVGLALLKNLEERAGGAFTVAGRSFDKTETGSLAVVTAVCHGGGEGERQGVKAVTGTFTWEGDVLHAVVPMERAVSSAQEIYQMLMCV